MSLSNDAHLLACLLDHGPQTSAELQRRVGVVMSVVSERMNDLARIGFVERRMETESGPAHIVWSIGQRIRLGVARDAK